MIGAVEGLEPPTHGLQSVARTTSTTAEKIPVGDLDPSFNGGDFIPAVLVPQQAGQPTAEILPKQSAAAVQSSVSLSDFRKRFRAFGPRGWSLAR